MMKHSLTTAFALCLTALIACSGTRTPENQPSAVTSTVSGQTGAGSTSPHVPLYTSNVTKTDTMNPGQYTIDTKDSVDEVLAWYRKNLPDQNGETVTSDGAHIFYTHNGSTVDIEPNTARRFDPKDQAQTIIGVTNAP